MMRSSNQPITGILGVSLTLPGLLLDTESLGLLSLMSIFWARGRNEDPEKFRGLLGLNAADFNHAATEQFNGDVNFSELLKLRDEVLSAYLTEYGAPLKAGARELVRFLREQRLELVVNTSLGRAATLKQLELSNLLDFTPTIVTGDDVEKGKPSPESHLLACKLLSIPPAKCLVLEDCLHGVRGSIAAGCPTIMVPDLEEPPEEVREDVFRVCSNLDEVRALLEVEL